MTYRFRAFAFCVLVVTISVSGCKKEDQPATPIAAGNNYQLVDPFTDIIACLDGPHRTLYVLPEQRENVLKLLHAEASGDKYMMEAAMNIHHKAVPIGFQVVSASLNQLINVGAYFEIARAWIPSYNESANKDTARAKLLDTMTTAGVFYRMYLNAQCGKITDGHYTDCEEQISFADAWDTTRTTSPLKFNHVRQRFYPISHCLKGTGSCIEALGVSMTTEYYNNDNCNGAPTSVVETSYDFSCP
jgi:hypothetical protein